jgi:hypothetical protein
MEARGRTAASAFSRETLIQILKSGGLPQARTYARNILKFGEHMIRIASLRLGTFYFLGNHR